MASWQLPSAITAPIPSVLSSPKIGVSGWTLLATILNSPDQLLQSKI
ncbi:MAG TPA: hypothetical protein VIC26_12865 [Marinagarivorans sp.]